jgi:hypothetical protein
MANCCGWLVMKNSDSLLGSLENWGKKRKATLDYLILCQYVIALPSENTLNRETM